MKRTTEEVIQKNERYIMKSFPSRTPIVVVEGKGVILKDIEGKEYIDCFSGIAVTNVGHCHPKVVAAAKDQLEKLWHASGLYYTLPMTTLAEKLATITPGGLNRFFFSNSGAESVEGAVKLAKKYALKKGRFGFWTIAVECSFHGRTAFTLSLTGQNKYKKYMGNFANNPGVAHAMAPYCYRCPLKYPECGLYCATSLEDLIERRTTGDVAAIIIEPIIGEGGIIVPPDEYPTEVAKVCKNHNALLIADEVQTGFGRTGKMFAVDYWKVKPDIITMAKGLGAGLPIGAFAAAEEVASAFEPGDHFSTFGGNPVSCAAALANVEVLIDEKLPENARRVGKRMLDGLNDLAKKYKIIGDVRGRGLMIGVELVKDRAKKTPAADEANKVKDYARANGVIIGVGGVKRCTLRLQPPLVLTEAQADKVLSVIEGGLKSL